MKWNQRYNCEEYVYGTQPNQFLASVAELVPPNSQVLCLAEGEGRNAVYLAGLGHNVLAVDGSSVGLEKAQKLAKNCGVKIRTEVADLAVFEIEERKWDVIISIFAHIPAKSRQRLHQQIAENINPHGLLILEAYRPKQLDYGTGGPPVAELMMSLPDLEQELFGMDLIHAKEIDREVNEGTLHTGLGAVVQLVARK